MAAWIVASAASKRARLGRPSQCTVGAPGAAGGQGSGVSCTANQASGPSAACVRSAASKAGAAS